MSTVETIIRELGAIANQLPVNRRRNIIKALIRTQTNNNPANQDYWMRNYSDIMDDFLLSCVEDVRYNTHR